MPRGIKKVVDVVVGDEVVLEDDSTPEVRGILDTEDGWIDLQLDTGFDLVLAQEDELYVISKET